MLPEVWNKQTYKNFLNYLKEISDKKYCSFTKKLTFTKYKILGIRIPTIRKIGKKIYTNTDYHKFLKLLENNIFEEIMLEGQVIANIKNEEEFYKYFITYIKKIDDWSLCDTFCNSIKIVSKYPEKYFSLATSLALQKEEFESRVGLIIILNYFINEENLKDIFQLLNKISSDKYYVNMAEAWLICELFIRYPQPTEEYLKNNNLNKFTQNKAISKIRDSYRVSDTTKNYLNTLKTK